MTFQIRARGNDGPPASEEFEDAEEAHERFYVVCEERRTDRVSLYGPGGVLLRRRPASPETCHFCDQPASGQWPVSRQPRDGSARFRDVIALCPAHHAALARGDDVVEGWRWKLGHAMQ
jgi:hypothetical protein